jgi:hypothetical protein
MARDKCNFYRGAGYGALPESPARQVREESFGAVILSPFAVILNAVKHLALPLRVNYAEDPALCIFKAMQDSSSPTAPQNDSARGFFAARRTRRTRPSSFPCHQLFNLLGRTRQAAG